MAIANTLVGSGSNTIFLSSGNTAITFMSLCNTLSDSVTVSVYIVPAGQTPLPQHLIVTDLLIASKDTYMFYHAAEKIILSDGDYVYVASSDNDAIAAFVSYTGF